MFAGVVHGHGWEAIVSDTNTDTEGHVQSRLSAGLRLGTERADVSVSGKMMKDETLPDP